MRCIGKEIRQVRLRVGESICIELEAATGGGYVWSFQDPPRMLRVFEEPAQPGSGVGGGARQRFVVEAIEPGTGTLVFRYGRPWESQSRETHEVVVQADP